MGSERHEMNAVPMTPAAVAYLTALFWSHSMSIESLIRMVEEHHEVVEEELVEVEE
jgi:hypothetical protein